MSYKLPEAQGIPEPNWIDAWSADYRKKDECLEVELFGICPGCQQIGLMIRNEPGVVYYVHTTKAQRQGNAIVITNDLTCTIEEPNA